MPEKSYQDTVYVISVLFKTKQQRKHIKAGFSTHNCLIHTVTAGSKSLRGLNFAWLFGVFLNHFYCLKKFFLFSKSFLNDYPRDIHCWKQFQRKACTSTIAAPNFTIHRSKYDYGFLECVADTIWWLGYNLMSLEEGIYLCRNEELVTWLEKYLWNSNVKINLSMHYFSSNITICIRSLET